MASRWEVIGQVGKVEKIGAVYAVNIADNHYRSGEKIKTIWINAISRFEPRVKTGDSVIAQGFFEQSENPGFQYLMVIKHIAVIQKE